MRERESESTKRQVGHGLTMAESISRVLPQQFGEERGKMAGSSLRYLGHQFLSLIASPQSMGIVGLQLVSE